MLHKGDSHLVGGSVALENAAQAYLDFHELSHAPLPGEKGEPGEVRVRRQYRGNAKVPVDSNDLEKLVREGTKTKAGIAQREFNKWQALQGKIQIPENVKQVRKEHLTEVLDRVERRLDYAKDVGRKSQGEERRVALSACGQCLPEWSLQVRFSQEWMAGSVGYPGCLADGIVREYTDPA